MNLCKDHWTRSGTNVLLGRQRPPGRKQNTANRLILMGDWRDSFAAMIEEPGAVWLLIGNLDLEKLAAAAAMGSFTRLTPVG